MLKVLITTALGSLLAVAAFGQAPIQPADVLRAPAKSFKAGELPAGLRAVTINGPGQSASSLLNGSIFSAISAAGGGPGAEVINRIKMMTLLSGAILVDPDEFASALAAGRGTIRGFTSDGVSPLGMMMGMSAQSSQTKPLMPELTFKEIYLQASAIAVWQPLPELTMEAIKGLSEPAPSILAAPRAASARTQAVSNLKQVALGIIMYSNDYDDHFPKADSTAQAIGLVHPYLKNDSLWSHPTRGEVYYNTKLSGISLASIDSPAETPMLWERRATEGMRGVAFCDGHVKMVGEEAWDKIWKAEEARRKKKG